MLFCSFKNMECFCRRNIFCITRIDIHTKINSWNMSNKLATNYDMSSYPIILSFFNKLYCRHNEAKCSAFQLYLLKFYYFSKLLYCWITFLQQSFSYVYSPFIRPKFGKLHEATCAVSQYNNYCILRIQFTFKDSL